MKSALLFMCIVATVVLGADPATEPAKPQENTGGPHGVALQNALQRMGLSNEWYSNMVFLSQPVEALQLPRWTAPAAPASSTDKQASLLQEGAKMSAEMDEALRAGATASANPTYVLPAAPMVASPLRPEPDTYVPSPPQPFAMPPSVVAGAGFGSSPFSMFPAASQYPYNPYNRIPYGYGSWRAPIFAPGGGAPVMGGDPNAGAVDPNDYFAAQAIQDPSRDIQRVFAGGSTNPLWFPSPSQRGSLAYFPGIVAAAPQGPTSEPVPFTVGDNPPSDFPRLRQLRARAAAAGAGAGADTTAFAEEAALALSKDNEDKSTKDTSANTNTKQQQQDSSSQQHQQQQQQQQQPQQQQGPPPKRYFRPETVGDPPKLRQGRTKSGGKVALESLKTPHQCDGCNFED